MYLELLAIIAGYGLANILVNEDIFIRPRMYILTSTKYDFLKALVSCIKCMSFWAGTFCGLLLLGFTLNIIVVGFATHAFTVLVESYYASED